MRILDVIDGWRACGLREGDTVLLHSNAKRTLRAYLRQGMRIGAGELLKSFFEVVGKTGTLLLPLFNFGFTKGVPFNIRTTPSQMGALTEAARQMPGTVRTGHPIYSFGAIGAQAGLFLNVDNYSGYGPDSPFALLRELDGKIAVLDLPDQNSMTFYHHVEEMLEVPYRHHKQFNGQYTDAEGVTTVKTYSLFVRDLGKGVLTHVDPAGELLWAQGLYSGSRPNQGVGLRVVSARALFDFVSDIIRKGRAEGLLYRVDKKSKQGPS